MINKTTLKEPKPGSEDLVSNPDSVRLVCYLTLANLFPWISVFRLYNGSNTI